MEIMLYGRHIQDLANTKMMTRKGEKKHTPYLEGKSPQSAMASSMPLASIPKRKLCRH